MSLGEAPGHILTGNNNAATAISRGQAVVRNAVADGSKVIKSGAATAGPAGIAMEDVAAVVGTTFAFAASGYVKGKVGAAGATQNKHAASDASGNFVDAATGAISATYGRFMETGVSGDLVLIEVNPLSVWV